MSNESKKGVHQITLNNYLFYNSPEILYSLIFEIFETNKIRVILIKYIESDTFIFDAIVPYTDFGTEEATPLDALKKVSFLIYNYNFIIKEELNKAYLYINTRKPSSIELHLHDQNHSQEEDLYYDEQIKNM